MRVQIERRTLLVVLLLLVCIGAPRLHMTAKLAAGVDNAAVQVAARCSMESTGDGVAIEFKAIQGVQLACDQLQRSDDGAWEPVAQTVIDHADSTACRLERAGAAATLTARVRNLNGAGSGAAVCDSLKGAGWKPA